MDQNLSTAALIKASLIAAILAALAFVCAILPAEFNQDPTGVGKMLGLTQIATAEAEDNIELEFNGQQHDVREDSIEVIVPAGKGIEYKLTMNQYAKVQYEWLSDGDAIYFDLHGEPVGDTTGYFESYTIATLAEVKGSFTAPFAGTHGWYWKNSSSEDISILLQLKGQYQLSEKQ